MNQDNDSLVKMVEILQRTNPELLDIISAKTEEDFDKALSPVIEKAVIHLEKNKKNFAKLNEEGLTGVFAACLMGIGLQITQETKQSHKIDLIIRHESIKFVSCALLN